MRHCDSGRACSAHQSPVALNAGINDALHRVHRDSGTWWPPHQSSWEPGFAPAAACAAGPPGAGALAEPSAAFVGGSLAASLLSQLVAPSTRITNDFVRTTRMKSHFLLSRALRAPHRWPHELLVGRASSASSRRTPAPPAAAEHGSTPTLAPCTRPPTQRRTVTGSARRARWTIHVDGSAGWPRSMRCGHAE